MTNQVTTDAEESETIEKTAIELTETAAPQTQEATNDDSLLTTPDETAAAGPDESEPTAQIPEQEAKDAPTGETAGEEPPIAETSQPQPVVEVAETASAKASAMAPASEETVPSGDIDFGAILEQFEQEQIVFHSGELVTGTVVGITDRGVLIDFGYKSEGFVPPEEFQGPDGAMEVTVGESVDVVIRNIHSGDGAPQLSREDAVGRKIWDDIEASFQAETPVIGKVVDKTKGGLRVDLNGIEAFLPGSQIDSRPIRSLDGYIGQEIEAKIIKFSRRRNNIVLSRKVITDEVANAQKAETLSKLDVGYIVDGTIKNLTEYGAFVDIGGIDGLLHVTDMSWGRIHHPADHFKAGDHIQVKVLKLDLEREKISLGYKQLLSDPWSTVLEVYPVDSKVNGTISSVTEYGVFVELEPGVEGLVHVSEISWSRRAQSPKRIFQKGQIVEVQVLGVDTVEKRISLGMKQFQDNPWETVDVRYPVGARVQGRVRNITDFGAFVELEEGIDGLVHVSDISWGKKINHPKDVLKKDQEVEAIVTSIDKRGQRLSLSMKDLTPSAWEGFAATHRPGDMVKGKVTRFTSFGVFVELGEGLEGLCHISELSDERVERAEDIAQLGQEMDFKILRIENSEQKIGLSHRAVGKEDEPIVDTRIYSSEAKGGMASLGELANMKFGTAATEETPPEEKPVKERKRTKKAAAAEAAESAEAADAEQVERTDEVVDPVADAAVAEEVEPSTELTEPVGNETGADDVEPNAEAAEPVVDSETAETDDVKAETEESPATEETPTAEVEASAAEESKAEVLPAEPDATVGETVETSAEPTSEVTEKTEESANEADEPEVSVDSESAAAVEEGTISEDAVAAETMTDEAPAQDSESKTA